MGRILNIVRSENEIRFLDKLKGIPEHLWHLGYYMGGLAKDEFSRGLGYCTFVLPEYKLLYVATPKCASLKIKLILSHLYYGERFQPGMDDGGILHHREWVSRFGVEPIPSLVSLSKPAYEEVMETYYKFGFVRDPYQRIRSVYQNRFVDYLAKNPSGPLLKDYCRDVFDTLGLDVPIGEIPSRIPTWDEFLACLERQPLQMMDGHWYPQYYSLFGEHIAYDKIGRLESFEADIQEVLESVGADLGKLPVELGIKTNTSDHKGISFTEEQKEIVRRKYYLDFIHFGYSMF